MAQLPSSRTRMASPEARFLFERSREMFGRVGNAVRVASASPQVMPRFTQPAVIDPEAYKAYMRGC